MSQHQKIIFLDMDGVMNSQESAVQFKTWHRCAPEAVEALNFIIRNAAKVVISSTWREVHTLEFMRGFLEGSGVLRDSVIDMTGVIRCEQHIKDRGTEIQAWLEANPTKKFVILDDDMWDFTPNAHRFVQTDTRVGLTMEQAERAVELLNQP